MHKIRPLNDDITDLTILQCFSNVRFVVCTSLKNLQKVILAGL